MKSILLLFLLSFCTFYLIAQPPQRMSYQAVIRNGSNMLVTNTAIGMRVSILQGSVNGLEVYKEVFSPNPISNSNGLITVEIGGGAPVAGTFAGINWANGPFFVKIETDPSGGSNYTISSTSQLLSVPYALHANTANNVTESEDLIFPFSRKNITPFFRRLFNNPYTVPTGKVLFLTHTTYAEVTNARLFKIDTNTIVDNDAAAVFLGGGTVISTIDTSISVFGFLINDPQFQPVFQDVSVQPYTVPTGKTLFLTHANTRVWPAFMFINNIRYHEFSVYYDDGGIPMMFEAGTTLKGNYKISGYLK